jgi:hypothetical protein
VLTPKALGAWNLHRLTADRALDCFLLFSSIASWLGLPGQGSYAAANAFLDGLAHHRRALGLPALSVGWTSWAGLGFAESLGGQRIRAHLAEKGVRSLAPEEALESLELLLRADAVTHALVMPLDRAVIAGAASAPRWQSLLGVAPATTHAEPRSAGLREAIAAATTAAIDTARECVRSHSIKDSACSWTGGRAEVPVFVIGLSLSLWMSGR